MRLDNNASTVPALPVPVTVCQDFAPPLLTAAM